MLPKDILTLPCIRSGRGVEPVGGCANAALLIVLHATPRAAVRYECLSCSSRATLGQIWGSLRGKANLCCPVMSRDAVFSPVLHQTPARGRFALPGETYKDQVRGKQGLCCSKLEQWVTEDSRFSPLSRNVDQGFCEQSSAMYFF